MNTEYKLSGNPGLIFILGLIVGPLLTLLLTIIYAYIDVYNPIVYFTCIVFVGLLLAIMVIQKLVVRWAKCRSVSSAQIYGLIIGLVAIYANWCTFLYVLLRKEDLPVEFSVLLTEPLLLFNMANALSEEGYFKLFGFSVSGGFLWFIWIVESAGILIAGILGGKFAVHEEVFCEDCNRWTEDIGYDQRISIPESQIEKFTIDTDLSELQSLPKAENLNSRHIRLNIHQCPQCQQTNTLDIDLLTYTTNNKGEIKESAQDFSPVYVLSKSQCDALLAAKHGQ